jgi:hypothetical protein
MVAKPKVKSSPVVKPETRLKSVPVVKMVVTPK